MTIKSTGSFNVTFITHVSIFIKCLDYVLGREILELTTVYVDDGLYVSNNKNTNADNILKQINNIHPKIQFTEEKEKQQNQLFRHNHHMICLLYTSRCV